MQPYIKSYQPYDIIKYPQIPSTSLLKMKHHKTSWNMMKHHETSRYLGSTYSTIVFHGKLLNHQRSPTRAKCFGIQMDPVWKGRDSWHGSKVLTNMYLVGGAITILKHDGVRQWEGWHPIYEMEHNQNVWNHQPGIHMFQSIAKILPDIVSEPPTWKLVAIP